MPHLYKSKSAAAKSKQLAAIKRQRTAQLTRVAARAAMLQRKGREDEAYTLICNEFVKLGGIYIKFLQGVLLNSPVLKRWHSPDKLKIFEGLDPTPLDIAALLQAELPAETLAQIAQIQPQPFAAGSFGQVYYGELRNGQQIIIKALRPQVRETLLHDLRLLGLFSRFFVGRHYKNYDIRLGDAIKDFRRATLAETDYVKEALFAQEVYEAHKGGGDLVIPRTYPELCTPKFIVQDYIGGISCAEVLTQHIENKVDPATYVQQKLGSNLENQLETLGVSLMGDCFTYPRVMGDPHPGNIRFLPDDKVALIDFGIAASAPANRPALYGLIREWSNMYNGSLNVAGVFEQFLRLFMNDLYRALKKLTSTRPSSSNAATDQNVMKNVGGVIRELFDGESVDEDMADTMNQGRLLKLFSQIINKGNRLGLVMKFEDSDILRAAQSYMSTVESLGLRGQVLPIVFQRIVTEQGAKYPDLVSNQEPAMGTAHALEIVNGWLERVANKDPWLFQKLLQASSSQNTKRSAIRPQKTVRMPITKEKSDA